uniref:FERM domain-containing protein n=1 Tax=Schistocephalus solidus TaxID=70667 RepID=A0A183SNI9_SCHSO
LEFRVKFYPARPDELKDDLTRYFLCLQLRQDLISGQLPCSFNTYVLLGAYVIQSEAGDYDPNTHEGIKYLAKVPFAPRDLQTNEMLSRIKDLHGCLIGKTPEQADALFLENARRLALYGVDLHRVTNEVGEELSLGVYHAGIVVYRGRLRKQHFSWPYIVEMSHKGKEFTLVVRSSQPSSLDPVPSGETPKPGQATSPVSKHGTRRRSKSIKAHTHVKDRVLVFKCAHPTLAKRLYEVVTEHHAFYRLREPSGPRRSNLLPGFETRKYHYNSHQRLYDENGGTLIRRPSSREGGVPPKGHVRRVTAQRRPEQYGFIRVLSQVSLNFASKTHSDYSQPAPFASLEDAEDLSAVQTATRSPVNSLIQDSLADESYGPQRTESRPVETPIIWNPTYEQKQVVVSPQQVSSQQVSPQRVSPLQTSLLQAPPHVAPPPTTSQDQVAGPVGQGSPRKRPELGREHWQMSPADCTQGLGMDLYGTDVATMLDAGWQGSRANRGIKGPGAYYYEVTILEDGDVRIGWATNSASLMLGTDAEGYGYGVDPVGLGSPKSHSNYGRFVHAGESHAMGMPAVVNDVIGCFLEIRKQPYGSDLEGKVFWSHNGQIVLSPSLQEIRIPSELATGNAFFPSASLKDARVAFNFGEGPFTYSPEELTGGRTDWLPPVMVPLQQVVHNVNAGWRINQFDVSSATDVLVSEDGRMIQNTSPTGWQGFRANKGVFGSGKYYYEVEQVENSGMARFGWALQDGSLLLGTDNMGYGFGVGPDGSQARKVFNGLSEPYGTPFRVGDVIGCFLDLDNGILRWSLNGDVFPEAYRIDHSFVGHPKSIFFPAGSLYNTTISVNYGDRPFKFEPSVSNFYK